MFNWIWLLEFKFAKRGWFGFRCYHDDGFVIRWERPLIVGRGARVIEDIDYILQKKTYRDTWWGSELLGVGKPGKHSIILRRYKDETD